MTPEVVQNKTLLPGYLKPASSFFLDAIRLTASLTVAFVHARAIWFKEKDYDFIPDHLAHGSVIIFFVLSGYVIAYTTGIKKRTLNEYAAARLSRLYSVVLPALFFTIIVSVALLLGKPGPMSEYSLHNSPWRYIISLLFCNEIWLLSAAPLLNGVIWSLSYEFWFYTIFGCWLYRNNHKTGMLFLLITILIAGPKILLMMLIWLLGAAAYRLPKPKISPALSNILIAVAMIISVILMLVLPGIPYPVNASKLYWASSFVSDFIDALFIAFAFWLLPLTKSNVAVGDKVSEFRKIADLTFPIYMFHYPCLVLIKSFNINSSYAGMHMAFLLTLVFCFFIGVYTERWHYTLKDFLQRIFRNIQLKSVISG